MKYNCTYMSGAGNKFVVLNGARHGIESGIDPETVRKLCQKEINRYFDAEGLMIISPAPGNSFSTIFYNPDGSSEMMCGNGGRCAVMFAKGLGLTADKLTVDFSMAGQSYQAELIGDKVKLMLPPPISIQSDISIKLEELIITGAYVNVNSDHFVISYNQLHTDIGFREFDIIPIARRIRYHKQFADNGVNVNIYNINEDDSIGLRTYERGVEAETGACGTGALSTMLALKGSALINPPAKIIPPSGRPIFTNYQGLFPDKITSLSLTGDAVTEHENIIEL